jgi:hypothetical protein
LLVEAHSVVEDSEEYCDITLPDKERGRDMFFCRTWPAERFLEIEKTHWRSLNFLWSNVADSVGFQYLKPVWTLPCPVLELLCRRRYSVAIPTAIEIAPVVLLT